MITKPAILECTRCGKIFIGWATDARPKRGPMCLKCQAHQAWGVLAGVVAAKKGRGGGGKRTPARKPPKGKGGRRKVAKRSVGKAARGPAAKRR